MQCLNVMALWSATVVLAALASGAVADDLELPVVPVAALEDPEPVSNSPDVAPAEVASAPRNDTPLEIELTPGVNEIINASIGHINRIVTPFPSPEVRSTSSAEMSVHENVIYVAPQSEQPVTMYITQSGDEALALSVTLNPRRIPPVEARLKVAGSEDELFFARDAASQTTLADMPYVTSLRAVVRALALGEVPAGYNLRQTAIYEEVCAPPPGLDAYTDGQIAFDFSLAQRIQGTSLIASVGRVTYQAPEGATYLPPIELNELWCADVDTAAVAFWPAPLLNAGESAEVFVVRRRTDSHGPRTTRPSLLDVSTPAVADQGQTP